jgi:hypothetical protein
LLLHILKAQEQLLRVKGIIVQIVARLEIARDAVKPVAQVLLLPRACSRLNRL